jgi:hypothetical protein
MPDPFHSAKRRVARAKDHIRDLERQISFFLDQKPYATLAETDADGVSKTHKIKFTKPIPHSLGDIAADAIDNHILVVPRLQVTAATVLVERLRSRFRLWQFLRKELWQGKCVAFFQQ